MRIGLSTAPLAFRLRGAGGSAVDNPTEQGFHLRNPKTCPNKPGHLSPLAHFCFTQLRLTIAT